jgi:hypothetical protein
LVVTRSPDPRRTTSICAVRPSRLWRLRSRLQDFPGDPSRPAIRPSRPSAEAAMNACSGRTFDRSPAVLEVRCSGPIPPATPSRRKRLEHASSPDGAFVVICTIGPGRDHPRFHLKITNTHVGTLPTFAICKTLRDRGRSEPVRRHHRDRMPSSPPALRTLARARPALRTLARARPKADFKGTHRANASRPTRI